MDNDLKEMVTHTARVIYDVCHATKLPEDKQLFLIEAKLREVIKKVEKQKQ